MTRVVQDLRYALGQLRKSPGFASIAVITLALGIGANTAIFSVIDSVLLRPLPFREPDRLVAVKTTELHRRDDIGVSYPEFLDWSSQDHMFEGLSVFRVDDFTLTGRAEPAHLTGAVVSANLFSLRGIAPSLVRAFAHEEDHPANGGLPVVLSQTILLSSFGAPAFVLTAVALYGVISYTVAHRTHEMGVRLAPGADRDSILAMIIKTGVLLAGTGIGVRLVAALLLTRLITSLLYGVSPTDPLTFIGVPIALMTMAVIASYLPARRAVEGRSHGGAAI